MASRRFKGRWTLLGLLLLAWGMAAVPYFLHKPAQLELVLRDSTHDLDLNRLVAVVQDVGSGSELRRSIESGPEGSRLLLDRVPSGTGELRIAVPGYRTKTIPYSVPALGHARLQVDLESLLGVLLVNVVDAQSGEQVSDAWVEVPEGERLTGAGIRIYLPEGTHLLTAQATGFCLGERSFDVVAGAESQVSIPLSKHLVAGEMARVILDWGDNPRDLDAHVLFEEAQSAPTESHVFFGHRLGIDVDGAPFAELDIDYLYSEGFETITLYQQKAATFRYFVHHYAGDGALATSQASVAVATRGCKRKTYTVPEDCSGRYWSVVDLRGEAARVDIIERSECSLDPPRSWHSEK